MQRKQVQFTRRQVAAIHGEARRRKTSDAAVVRQAVDQLLSSGKGATTGAERITRALAAVGRFASGRRDISREHDRELADAFDA